MREITRYCFAIAFLMNLCECLMDIMNRVYTRKCVMVLYTMLYVHMRTRKRITQHMPMNKCEDAVLYHPEYQVAWGKLQGTTHRRDII